MSDIKYTVMAGDTLNSIAQKFNVTIWDIVDANNKRSKNDPAQILIDPISKSPIKSGEVLIIPSPKKWHQKPEILLPILLGVAALVLNLSRRNKK